jgi:hypothetical protein
MPDMAYAVHTRSCTYLLDDDGICRWTLAPTGVPVPGVDRYLGAQFVACLDVREQGGLVGELRIGAAALFARSENGRLVLLRTSQIEFVEHRVDGADALGAVLPTPAPVPVAPAPAPVRPSYAPYVGPLPPSAPPPPYSTPTYAPPPYVPPPPSAPPYRASAYSVPAPDVDAEEEFLDPVDVEEQVTFSEVTLTIPLYRPEAQAATPPQRRGVIGPGRRLR